MQLDNKLNAAIFINEEKSETLNQDWEIKLSSAFTPEVYFFVNRERERKTHFPPKQGTEKGGPIPILNA